MSDNTRRDLATLGDMTGDLAAEVLRLRAEVERLTHERDDRPSLAELALADLHASEAREEELHTHLRAVVAERDKANSDLAAITASWGRAIDIAFKHFGYTAEDQNEIDDVAEEMGAAVEEARRVRRCADHRAAEANDRATRYAREIAAARVELDAARATIARLQSGPGDDEAVDAINASLAGGTTARIPPFAVLAQAIEKDLRERHGFTDEDFARVTAFANSFEPTTGRRSSPADGSPTEPPLLPEARCPACVLGVACLAHAPPEVRCPECGGTGLHEFLELPDGTQDDCRACGGYGRVTKVTP